ncbi:MAG: FAD-binding oxidoreductase [Candidatus Eiseniibacteriota bacterium]
MSATLGLNAARACDPAAYAISGRPPRFAVRPETREELSEALRAAALDRLRVVPWGGGVALARESAPAAFDVALDTRGISKIIEYNPDDLTLTAECGASLETLRETLAARGQELPIEAAEDWGATLGGALAANACGARRAALGAPRDRILGARFALGDGTIARSGGKVVKNVAGYGIHRLLCGSRGALAVIVEASLKLQPAPASRAALVYAIDRARLAEVQRWERFARMRPAVLTVLGAEIAERDPTLAAGDAFAVVVGLEGEAADVELDCDRTREALGVPRLKVSDASAATLWQRLADFEELPGTRLSFTSAHLTPEVLPALPLGVLGRAVFHAACGRLHVFPGAGDPTPLVREIEAHGFTMIAVRGARIEPPIPPQIAVKAMRAAIRSALDPGSRFSFGEAWEGGPAV